MIETFCKGCGAHIAFVKTLAGRAMPVDLPGEQRLVQVDRETYEVRMSYKTHFATCPKAKDFRKGAEE